MREVLADAAAFLHDDLQRRRDGGGDGVVFEVVEYAAVQVQRAYEEWCVFRKARAPVVAQLRRGRQQRRVETKLVRLDYFRRNRVAKQRGHLLPLGRQRAHRPCDVRDGDHTFGGDFEALMDFLDAEKANQVAEIIGTYFAQ